MFHSICETAIRLNIPVSTLRDCDREGLLSSLERSRFGHAPMNTLLEDMPEAARRGKTILDQNLME